MDAPAVETLVVDLSAADFNRRAGALAELVRRGHEATPALIAALGPSNAELRAQLTQGLAEIADPAGADCLASLTHDEDERVRAYAASGLAWLHDPRAPEALVRTIDDFPDVLRDPFTPSVDALIARGAPALSQVAPLLGAPQAMTRVHAFLVIRMVLSALPEAGDWAALARTLGEYDPTGPEPARTRAARQWQAWIGQRFPGT